MTSWPQCGEELLTELRRAPGRLALVVDDRGGSVAKAFAKLQLTAVCHAGVRLLSPEPPTSSVEVIDRLAAAEVVIVDLDLLFWRPWLALDPIGVLRAVSRRRPATLFAWPGTITGNHTTYSSPGRRDWFDASLSDAVVLRPTAATFPDEPPYSLERHA